MYFFSKKRYCYIKLSLNNQNITQSKHLPHRNPNKIISANTLFPQRIANFAAELKKQEDPLNNGQ